MTRMSKQSELRAVSPRRPRPPSTVKTGRKKDNLPSGYKAHENTVIEGGERRFIPKVK